MSCNHLLVCVTWATGFVTRVTQTSQDATTESTAERVTGWRKLGVFEHKSVNDPAVWDDKQVYL